MARNKGTFNFAANFQVKMQEALDPRLAVAAKADLIDKETWPYDGDTLYLYEGMIVSVVEEQSAYMLVDLDNALATDYSGWLRMDAGNAEQVEVVDSLTSTATDKALSANQGNVLLNRITSVEGKVTSIYRVKGSKSTYAELPSEGNETGDVWNVEEAYGGHPAGTNYVWNGAAWDALGGSIDLSNYYTKDEVAQLVAAEKDRAEAAENAILERLDDADADIDSLLQAQNQQKASLESVSQSLGELNLLINGNSDPDDDIEDQEGIVSRLEKVEGIVLAEGDGSLLTRVEALEERMDTAETGITANSEALKRLNAASDVAGSVDYKIAQALAWENVD